MKKSLIYFALSILSVNLTYAQDIKITQPAAQVAAAEEDEMFVEEEQDLEEDDLEDFDET